MPIDLNHPERHPIIERMFIEATGRGLRPLNPEDVRSVTEYLKDNTVRGHTERPSPGEGIDEVERQCLDNILRSEQWQRLFTGPATLELQKVLGIREDTITGPAVRPGESGSAPVGTVRGNSAWKILAWVGPANVTNLFNQDYERLREQLFENDALPVSERAELVYFLLQDYAAVLNRFGGGREATRQRRALLRAYFAKPHAAYWGAKDSSGDYLGNAVKVVFGTDPNVAASEFDIDRGRTWCVFQSMSGTFLRTAKKIDEWKEKHSLPANVHAYESASPLNWIVGETAGNTKPSGTFSEERAIKSTGVNWAVKLLPDESVVQGRMLDPDFEMKVAFLGWSNEFVTLDRRAGESLVAVHDTTGEQLRVEVEEIADDGWRPVFKDNEGNVVQDSDFTVVIKDPLGRTKGNGKANGTYSAWWWGLCDINASQRLVTTKYGFTKPEKNVFLDGIEFTKDEIASIVGRRLSEIIPTATQAGFRNEGSPDQLIVRGQRQPLRGKIESPLVFYAPDTLRYGNEMTLLPTHHNFPHGTVVLKDEDGKEIDVEADDIVDVTCRVIPKSDGTTQTIDTLRVRVKDQVRTHRGTLQTSVPIPGKFRMLGGGIKLKTRTNAVDRPILGELKMRLPDGETVRVPVSKVAQITREDKADIIAVDALFYILRNKGIFCADTNPGPNVCNTLKTIEAIRGRWTSSDLKALWEAKERGEKVLPDVSSFPRPDQFAELTGIRGKVQDPDKLLFFSLGNKTSSYSGLKFWVEIDENRVPINCKFVHGQWDFLWSVEGQPDWDARPKVNPNVPNDLIRKLYVNSLEDPQSIAHLLWEGWEDDLLQVSETPGGTGTAVAA